MNVRRSHALSVLAVAKAGPFWARGGGLTGLAKRIGLVVLTVTAACTERASTGGPRVVERDSAGVTIIEHPAGAVIEEWRLAVRPSAVIGGDESRAEAQLFWVLSATRLTGGAIAVGNHGTAQILVFDSAGRRLAEFGRRGGGPGEFEPGFVLVWPAPGDDVLVENIGFRRKLSRFSRVGALLQETVLPAQVLGGVGWFGAGTSPAGTGFLLGTPLSTEHRPGSGLQRSRANIVRFTYAGDGPDTIASYSGSEFMVADVGPQPAFGGGSVAGPRSITPLFAASSRLAGGGEPWHSVAGDQASAAFDVYDEAGRLVRRVRWPAAGRAPTDRDVELARSSYLAAGHRRQDAAGAARSLDVMPRIERTPVFDELVVGRDNTVWVRRYVLPADSIAGWWAFAESGRARAQLNVPAGLHVLEFGADYLLGRQTDDLGVERIEFWLLLRD